MIFQTLNIKDARVIHLEKKKDPRGYFARTFCEREFNDHGIDFQVKQCNISYNRFRGILRGMHYQKPPFEEPKLVSCIQGEIYDVILDIRRDSPTFGQWTAVHLSAENSHMLYIPKGLAHGFQTLQDHVLVHYAMGEYYDQEFASGIRWNDDRFRIHWPIDKMILSERDRQYPDYQL